MMTPTDAPPIYSQRDPRWAADHYGWPEAVARSTIGAYGCGITAIAQKLTLMGWPTTPPEVQAALLATNAFVRGGSFNFINWWNVQRAFPQLHYNGRHDHPHTPVPARIMNLLYERVERGEQTILYVDASPYEQGLQQHFVLMTGRSETGELLIHNPWNGKAQDLRPYGKTDPIAICGVILLDRNFDADRAI